VSSGQRGQPAGHAAEPAGRRAAERAAGALLGLAALGVFPLAIDSIGHQDGLHVDLSTPGLHASAPSPSSPLPAPAVGPPSLLPRLQLRPRPAATTGLSLLGYRVDYSHRWEREITLPLLTGPFDAEGAQASCGLALRLGRGLFAGPDGSAAFSAEAARMATKFFPATYSFSEISVEFPAVERVEARLDPRVGVVHVSLLVHLIDGTEVSAETDVRLGVADGRVRLERAGPVKARWSGKTRDDLERNPLVAGAMMLDRMFGGGDLVGKLAQAEIGRQADGLLSQVNVGLEALHEPFVPFHDRPDDRAVLRVARAPRVDPQGITLSLCPLLSLAPPLVDPAMRVVPRLRAAPPLPSPSSAPSPSRPGDRSSGTIELVANADGLNQLVYLLWQTGGLRALGGSSVLLDSLPEAVRALAFDVTGFDPLLPPLAGLPTRDDGLSFTAANVALGRWGDRTVLGHADLLVGVASEAGAVRVRASLLEPRVDCAELRADGRYRLTPCLADLLPVAREALAGAPASFSFSDGALLDALSRRSFASMKLEVGDLVVSTDASRGEVHALIRARLLSSPAAGP
jgi:hypothetical protein